MTLADVADWGLQTGLVVSFLIGLVLMIRRPFARYFGAGAAYALWLLPALRLFMPTITVPFLRRSVPDPITYTTSSAVPQTYLANPERVAETASQISSSPSSPSIWAILAGLWLGLALLWFGFQLLQQHHFLRHMRESSAPTPKDLNNKIERARGIVGLRREPDIRLSDEVSGPMVTGLIHPLILLPSDFDARFNIEQQVFALVHEMAHIKRGDLWVALAMLGFRALFWPNPLVHFAAHKMRIDQEAACDAAVIARTGGYEATHSYAQTLVQAAKLTKQSGQKNPLGLALSEPDSKEKFSKGDENDKMD